MAGIAVPKPVQEHVEDALDPLSEGIANAGEVFAVARRWFAGALLMPPFGRYDILQDIL